MKILALLFLIFFGTGILLSQELTFSVPIKLGSTVNSEAEELGPLMSGDGKTLYFSRAFYDRNTGGKYAGTDIWVSKKNEQGQWLPAVNMNNKWNNKLSNSVIGINQDHSIVYLLNAYSNKSGISFSKFYSGEWRSPEFIPIPDINRSDFVGFYANPKFDVILISMKGKDSFGEEDLYVSLKDSFGNWTEPKNLGATINTKGFEISPFLTEDKKRLFFASNGHPGFGDADIFYCDRLFDSWETWSVPKNLGDKINSKFFDAYFSLYDSIGYFSSSRINNQSEIYKTDVNKNRNTISFDRQYLTPKEVGELIGNSVSRKIIFEGGSSVLNSGQKELLYYIANKLLTKTEIKFQLTGLGEESILMRDRLNSIIEQLTSVGIDSYRVRLVAQALDGKVEPNTIEISFFR
ncbi:MAG: PD40 domain-containing protein [Cyclobacteriaceae bacterium]|nr:PD40 domain-containing protein [Cyclobacteriaceae bacterium]